MATYSTLNDFSSRIKSSVEGAMFQGETFLGAIDTRHLFRFISQETLILTDQRIILFKKGLIRESTRDFDRDRISNVKFDKGIIFRNLKISGSGFSQSWQLPYEGGQEFAAAIRSNEPNKIYDTQLRDTRVEEETTATDDVSTSGSDLTERVSSANNAIEDAQLTNPDTEIYGFDNWHFVTAGVALIGFIAAAASISDLVSLAFVVTAIALYLDTKYMREASTWNPRAWLYIAGLLIGFLSVPVYLYNRYRVTSNNTTSGSTVDKG